MNIATLAAKNILRKKGRTVLTVLGVALAILFFVLLRTVISSWTNAVEHAAKDRIGTRHKITFVMSLPKVYYEKIKELPEIEDATYFNWFGGIYPQRETEFFGSIATDPKTFFDVYDEVVVPPEQKQAWIENKRGALVGDVLARKMGWKVGDRVTLRGTIFSGDWDFEISGIYELSRRTLDRSTFWFHWDYLNDSLPPQWQDQVGWIVSRVDDPGQTAAIAKKVDAMFEERDIQTLSMSERAMNVSFLGMISAVLDAVDIVSIVILVIMMLILGNTIAMGVRERTHEYGCLRAIGFRPRHIATFVVGEALTIGILGAALGLLLAYPMVDQGVGRVLEESFGALFPYVRVGSTVVVASIVLALVLGGVAAAIPAWRASRLDIVDALRRVE